MKKFPISDNRTKQGLPAAQLFSPPLVGEDQGEGARGRGFSSCRTRLASTSSAAGFTLIEVLVAIVILVFGLLAVGSMQIAAIRGNFMGGNTSIALTLASQKMEDLLNKDFNHADLTDSRPGNNGTLSTIVTGQTDSEERVSEEGVVGAGGFYRRIWNIANQNSPSSKSIMVIVTWENNKHRISIASIKRP